MANDSLRLSTPEGTAVFPALQTPDTKFNENGVYKADLAVPLQEAEPLMEKLADIHKSWTGKAPKKSDNTMWYFETDKETGEETGNVVFKLRVKNIIRKRDGKMIDRRPKLFDASLRPIDVNPWGGTRMVVSFDVYEWAANQRGVSLQPVGVQIINLVQGGASADPEAMGFKARDDGFQADSSVMDSNDDTEAADVEVDETDGDY
jgi:hypothetical protein